MMKPSLLAQKRGLTTWDESRKMRKVDRVGSELPPLALSKTPISQDSPEKRTESGTQEGENPLTDRDLSLLIERWPKLHPATREHILSILSSTLDKEQVL
jgi:hypothetical protein